MASGGAADNAPSKIALDYGGRPAWMQLGGQAAAGTAARLTPQTQTQTLPQPLYTPPPKRRILRLTKETRAALGHKTSKHTRCIRCWKHASEEHRRQWLDCRGDCPRCDDEHQHFGQACPQYQSETNDEWWMAHCGIPKDKIPFAYLPGGLFGSSVTGLPARPFPVDFKPENRARGQDPWQGRLRARSRSPPPRDDNGQGRDYRDRQPLQPSLLRAPQVKAEAKSSQPQLEGRSDRSSSRSPISSTEPRPTGIVWSDGTVTAPSVRELVAHDPWMAMLIHQTVKIADFFQRHPEQSKGEDLVSAGMAQYLSEIRSDQPGYLMAGDGSSRTGEVLGQGN